MAEITASKLSKFYGIKEIFTDISFNLNEKDRVGIVGKNGAGKTTLFNILTGNDLEFEGNVYKRNDLKIGYMLQNTSIYSEKTIYEEMLSQFSYIHDIEKELKKFEKLLENHEDLEELEKNLIKYNDLLNKYSYLGGEYFETKIETILVGMGFSKERFNDDVNVLSGGEKSRLELAKLLVSDVDVLFLDEPTNHLDMETIEFLESMIRDLNKLVVFISHDRYFLDKVANRIFLLDNGKLKIYDTNYSNFIERRKKEIEIEKRAYENQQREIARQEEIIERFTNLGGSKRKRGISQSRSRQKLLDKMKVLDKPEFYDEQMSLKFSPRGVSGKDVLEVRGLSKSFGDKTLYKDISFNIYRGEKVGLIGGNGTGKTTLFKMILNKMKPDNGKIDLGVSVYPEYFDQEQKTLDLDKTVIDEIWDKYPSLTHYEIRTYLAKFMFIGDDIFNIVEDLSGGEKSRILLLELMLSDANFLLMDEPTNHLDIDSKEVLEDALLDYEATAFIISHDRYFLNKVCDKIIEIKNGKINIYHGNYDYYLTQQEKNNLEEVTTKEEITKTQRIKDYKKQKEEQKLIRQKKNKIEKIENRLEEIEELINNINKKFMDSSVYEDFEEVNKLQEKLDKLNKEKDEISHEWLEINEEIESIEIIEEV